MVENVKRNHNKALDQNLKDLNIVLTLGRSHPFLGPKSLHKKSASLVYMILNIISLAQRRFAGVFCYVPFVLSSILCVLPISSLTWPQSWGAHEERRRGQHTCHLREGRQSVTPWSSNIPPWQSADCAWGTPDWKISKTVSLDGSDTVIHLATNCAYKT